MIRLALLMNGPDVGIVYVSDIGQVCSLLSSDLRQLT
jgi:hypothetical protein